MLAAVGVGSLEELADAVVPSDIRRDGPLTIGFADGDPGPLDEAGVLERLRGLGAKNRVMTSMIGQGYHGTHVPPVIQRCVLENPLWYTPYTPYQAELAQGRLEALLNFQTLVSDLTGLPLANASLLDEATAAAEAMAMCVAVGRGKRDVFVADAACHPQTLAVLRTRASGLGVSLAIVDCRLPICDWLTDAEWVVGTNPIENRKSKIENDLAGVLVQYPDTFGVVRDYEGLAERVHEAGAMLVAAADPLALVLLEEPGAWGADIAVGSMQRFGVPMGFGGPHAAYLATHEKHARKMPGRIVGVSRDARGQPAYRLAIQTREQHIKRDRATSNICTAQVLLAVMAGFYAVYHGPDGLRRIAERVHGHARSLAEKLRGLGCALRGRGEAVFDTVTVEGVDADAVIAAAADRGINLRRVSDDAVGIACDQTTEAGDVEAVIDAFRGVVGGGSGGGSGGEDVVAEATTPVGEASAIRRRRSAILTHEVFNAYHAEHELLRYITRLQSLDVGLAQSMIPLGSCTMKLNAAVEMQAVTWPQFAGLHPFAPADQTAGYRELFDDLERWIAACTGFDAVSLQPNAGSQGEYAGLLAIRGYQAARGGDGPAEADPPSRDVCLIPTSAHGTNPASAVMVGLKVVPVGCRPNGDIDLDDLKAKAEEHADRLCALMITYPSTHGVFERGVRQACAIVHEHGGLVYMDGANLNAQVGLCTPADIGADVCHLNLHKTFCIPHGGGGPGMGPIAVTERLVPFLPGSGVRGPGLGSAGRAAAPGTRNPIVVSAAPYGSPLILTISWAYIALMRGPGLTRATQVAILNANYMAAKLSEHFDVLYAGEGGRVAHEFILDCRPFEKTAGVTVEDIAKRLMDFGFHAPTMSWPVAGTLMIEPTESESKAELDRFCEAMIAIRREIAAVADGLLDREDNPLKHAPHPAEAVTSDDWSHPYGREQAAYPLPWLRDRGRKFFPAVARIDNPYGDRNLVCTCPSVCEVAD